MSAPLYLLSATFLFTALNVCVKYLPHIPASELILFRGFISLAICYLALKKMKISVWGNNKKLLVLRGFFGTVSLFALFYGLQHMPIAVAMTLSNLAPLFTVMLAHFFLREKSHWLHGIFLLGAFAGVAVIKGWDPTVSWGLALLGIFGAFCAACAYTFVRVLRHTDHALVVIFYFPLISFPLMIIPASINWVTPKGWDYLLILLIGILTQFAQYFMTKAYQLEQASRIMIYNYAAILWALLVGAIFFNEYLEGVQWAGLALIIICLLASAWLSRKESRATT